MLGLRSVGGLGSGNMENQMETGGVYKDPRN